MNRPFPDSEACAYDDDGTEQMRDERSKSKEEKKKTSENSSTVMGAVRAEMGANVMQRR